MSSTQVTAANILLRKVVPDLSSTELTGNPDKPVNMALGIVPIAAPKKK